MLQDVPDYAQRRRLLEGLKNRLEALLSPKIVAAFNNHSLGNIYGLMQSSAINCSPQFLFLLLCFEFYLISQGQAFKFKENWRGVLKGLFLLNVTNCKNCKWKLQIAENLRMLERWWNSTEIWNSEQFLTLTSRIGLSDSTGKLKWTGKVWLWYRWKWTFPWISNQIYRFRKLRFKQM